MMSRLRLSGLEDDIFSRSSRWRQLNMSFLRKVNKPLLLVGIKPALKISISCYA